MKIAPLSGFPEFLPAERIVEQHILDLIRATFELHGFSSIETRSVEPIARLVGSGEDADKEIYGVHRLAAGANDAELGLHFDLTVPFARYVLENAGKLNFPFRRYQIQKVWRGERPQEGRFREFTQADIDVVDSDTLAPHFEAELPLVVAEIFRQLPIDGFSIQVNNRKIAEGLYRGVGIDDIAATLRIVDKLDKIGPQATAGLLSESGCSAEQVQAVLGLAEIRSHDLSFIDQVRQLGVTNDTLEEGLTALGAVIETGMALAPGTLLADLRIARGLDYYTGTVYETQIHGHEDFGSVCSGGRYDALASDGKVSYPGVGISIGVSRLLSLLTTKRGLTASRSTPSVVLVAVADEDARLAAVAVANTLRARGIATEVSPSAAKFGKQIRYADRRGIPFVWFTGPDGDEVKDLHSGEQLSTTPQTWQPPGHALRPALRPGD